MSNKLYYTLVALLILIAVGTPLTIWIVGYGEHLDDEICIRRGYVKSMELWGLDWCVRMENGGLVGVQVEGESK